MLGMTLCRVARISVSVSVSYKRRSSLIYPILQFAFCILHFALRFIAFPLAPSRLAISHFAFVVTLCALRYALCVFLCFSLCPLPSAFFYSPCDLRSISLYYIFPSPSWRAPPGISDGRFQGSLSSFAGSSCPPKPRFHNPSRCNPRRCGKWSPPRPA